MSELRSTFGAAAYGGPGENDGRGVSGWRKTWTNGPPNEGRSPKSGHRMAAQGMQFPWRWIGDTISPNLGVIWETSVDTGPQKRRTKDVY